MGNYWINFNKSCFSFKNLCDLRKLCGELNYFKRCDRVEHLSSFNLKGLLEKD